MGMGIALRLAGMGGAVYLYRSCDSCNRRHSAEIEYETFLGGRCRIDVSILSCLLVERRETSLEMGRQEIEVIDPNPGPLGSIPSK